MSGINSRLFNALCLLSLVLAVAVAALWVRSASTLDVLGLQPWGEHSLFFVSNAGVISIGNSFQSGLPWLSYHSDWAARGPAWRYESVRYPQGFAVRVDFPTWLLMVPPSLVLFASVVNKHRPVDRLSPLCPRCGYDLRGSGGPACPECGEATPSTRSA